MKYATICLDISNIYHRSFAVSSNLTHTPPGGDEIITGGVYTSIITIRKLIREQLEPGGRVYCLCDSNVKSITDDDLVEFTNYRREIDPDYKSNRSAKEPSFYEGLNVLKAILLNFGDEVYTIEVEGLEADDLVYPVIAERNPQADSKLLMVSGDLDWARSITDNVNWQNHQKDIHNRASFYTKYGFYPEKLELQKSFRGDSSDGIPKGVKGIRENTLNIILSKYNTVEEIKHNIMNEEFLSDTWKNKIINNYSRLKLNSQLVAAIPISISICKKYTVKSEFKASVLRMLYRSMGFKISAVDPRLLREFPEDKPTAKNFFQKEKLPRA